MRIFLFMILTLCLFFAACGDDDDDDSTDSEPSDDDVNDDADNDADDDLNDDVDDDLNDDVNDDLNDDIDDDVDDDTDDDFVPPSPVYGYYDEGDWSDPEWMNQQLDVFAEYGLTFFLAMDSVRLGDEIIKDYIRLAETKGVEIRAWILLPYADGYWANEENAQQFADTARAFAQWFIEEDLPVEWIVVDMEMNHDKIYQLNQMIADGDYINAAILLLGNLDEDAFNEASNIYQQMVDDLEAMGFYSMVVSYPQILDDLVDEDATLQDFMDVPISTVGWHEVSTMVYTTTFDEILGAPFGPYIVYDYALSTVEYFGNAASIALGVSGDMEDLARIEAEIAASKAAGIERIQVYSYRSTLRQPNPDDWHAAFDVGPATPPWEANAFLMRSALQLADRIF